MRQYRRYTEHAEQSALIRWVRLHERIDQRLATLYAVPNGEHRLLRVAARLKREGVRAGVPDICLPVEGYLAETGDMGRRRYGSLYLEFKSATGRPSAAQQEWAAAARGHGPKLVVCRSWIVAATIICEYLDNPKLRPPQ